MLFQENGWKWKSPCSAKYARLRKIDITCFPAYENPDPKT
jgi:hypothetical protein